MLLAPSDRSMELRCFIQDRAGVPTPKGPTQVLGFVDEDGAILAGWMFERYTGVTGSVHAHWAAEPGKNWLNRTVLTSVAMYLFEQLAVNVVFGEVRRSDTKVREIDERLGFEKVAILEGYFPGDDLVLYSMTKDSCRWLPAEFKETSRGQKV